MPYTRTLKYFSLMVTC